MPEKKIITLQDVSRAVVERSKELRQQMTSAERILWQVLRANRLGGYHFRRQQVVGRVILDFYCHQASLVVEVDGEIHRAQAEYDRERDLYLADRGLKVLRVSNQDVEQRLDQVLATILAVCEERAGPLS